MIAATGTKIGTAARARAVNYFRFIRFHCLFIANWILHADDLDSARRVSVTETVLLGSDFISKVRW
jgi:hypothetical protein